jgi:lysyl-tRNA synthetase class 2
MYQNLNDQEIIRRNTLAEIKQSGIDPYPAPSYLISTYSSDILASFDSSPDDFKEVSVAGRLMMKRSMGKASFAELMDSKGRIQLYLKKDELADAYELLFSKWLDLGDFIGVTGYVFRTKMGEITIHVKSLTLLSKSLKVLPVVKTDAEGHVHDAFSDPELRYRMRYVDLLVNAPVREIFIKRSRLVSAMRRFFDAKGWLEVETPILQSVHGGAAARPFATHHNALDIPLYLRIANELYLKRLIVGGFEGVYEIGKMFRNEGMDRTHNPEFTMMEIYVAYKDYEWMMGMVEELLETLAISLHGTTEVPYGDTTLQFKGPFRRLSMHDAIKEYTGEDISSLDEKSLRDLCKSWHIEVDATMGLGKLTDEIFSAKVESNLVQPTYIIDHPLEMSPLAKKHRSKKDAVERFELFICGREIANAYSELNDPIDQRERFEHQLVLANRGDAEAMAMDDDFLRALEYGMPPTSGLGIGIDRLVMLMTNQVAIQEVLFFPQMKPENLNPKNVISQ